MLISNNTKKTSRCLGLLLRSTENLGSHHLCEFISTRNSMYPMKSLLFVNMKKVHKRLSEGRGVVRYFTGRVPSSQWRGSKCELPLPPNFFLQYLPHFTCFWMMIYSKSISCIAFLWFFFFWWVLVLIRTGAWHPLLNLSGCLGTRGTRSNDGPDLLKLMQESSMVSLSWFIKKNEKLNLGKKSSFCIEKGTFYLKLNVGN